MNRPMIMMICLGSGLLCQCSGPEEKKVDPSKMNLAQRSMLKPNENQRSRYEKYMNDPNLSKSSAGSYFQKQTHHSKNFNGGNSYSGQKEFKTGESVYGRPKSKDLDMTYMLGDKQALGKNSTFKADESRFGSQKAREGSAIFGGADNQFKTGSALTRSKSTGKEPKIIENYNDRGEGKKSAYTEDEVRQLLNRN